MVGRCYLYALETLFDLHANVSTGSVTVGISSFHLQSESAPHVTVLELGQGPVLVHGIVTGSEGDLKGTKFGHAWLEGNGYVMDCGSSEKTHCLMRREQYYDLWGINPDDCQVYTVQEATHLILATGRDSRWNDSSTEPVPN